VPKLSRKVDECKPLAGIPPAPVCPYCKGVPVYTRSFLFLLPGLATRFICSFHLSVCSYRSLPAYPTRETVPASSFSPRVSPRCQDPRVWADTASCDVVSVVNLNPKP
jgi:hypothetical protein